MIPDTIRRSSTLGIPCDKGKYGSIRRICASLSNHGSDIGSASSTPPLNQPKPNPASNLMGPEPSWPVCIAGAVSGATRYPLRLWKLSYVSVATAADAILEADVRTICALAETHNMRCEITGVLTHHAGRFVQLLEGPESEVRALMIRIAADPRHHSLKIIANGPIHIRRYADWSMAYRVPKDFMRDQLDDLLEQTAVFAEVMSSTLH
jgi:hypothetical protein